MAIDKAVDSAVLNAGLTATANAIRGKTGDSALIEWKNADGFKAAVDAIPVGGGGGGSDCIPLEGSFSYTVESVEGASYGFALNENGYYESQNKGQKSSYALCRIYLTTTKQDADIVFSVINYGENNWDYGIFGNLDVPLSLSTTADTDIKQSYKTISEPTANTLIYTVASPGEHFIDVKFIKDSSGDKNNDSVQFKIENAIKIPEEYYEILRQVDNDLSPKNIASGVDIFGVTGTYTGGFPNGTEWTQAFEPSKSGGFPFLLYGNGIWLTCYDDGEKVCTSEDGIVWTQSYGQFPSEVGTVYDGCFARGVFVVGTNAGICYSVDGFNWTSSNITRGVFRFIKQSNGIFVAAGNSTGLYYSTDGMTWNQSNVISDSYEGIFYCNDLGIWFAYGSYSYYSTDGMNWTKISGIGGTVCGFSYGNGIFGAVSSNGAWYSVDGVNWTKSNITEWAVKIHYSDWMWVVVARSGSIYYSTDGKNWILSNIQNAVTQYNDKSLICQENGMWVVSIENTGIYYSTDGMTWYLSNISTQVGNYSYAKHICHENGIWVAAFYQSSWGIQYSPTWLPS